MPAKRMRPLKKHSLHEVLGNEAESAESHLLDSSMKKACWKGAEEGSSRDIGVCIPLTIVDFERDAALRRYEDVRVWR